MRVKTNRDITFFYEMVPYSVANGTVVGGIVARHLLATGADVAPEDDEAAGFLAAREETSTADVAAPVDQLDIDAKIDDVLAWVGNDPERALEAHTAEEAKGDKARPRLLAKLTEIVEA